MDLSILDWFSSCGYALNAEEKSALSCSLIELRDSEKAQNVRFWGKILGIQKDYFVAHSWNAYNDNKYFYSLDGRKWLKLPDTSETDEKKSSLLSERFLGDPSFEYLSEEQALKEEIRLASVIKLLSINVSIAPFSSIYKNGLGNVVENKSFTGLSPSSLLLESSYVHPNRLQNNNTAKGNTSDAFETTETDSPKGVWSIQTIEGGRAVIMRNLLWPGYFFHHEANSARYSELYVGTGQQNHDVGFML